MSSGPRSQQHTGCRRAQCCVSGERPGVCIPPARDAGAWVPRPSWRLLTGFTAKCQVYARSLCLIENFRAIVSHLQDSNIELFKFVSILTSSVQNVPPVPKSAKASKDARHPSCSLQGPSAWLC